jgi:hypothetical protein
MIARVLKPASRLLALACSLSVPLTLAAQVVPAVKASSAGDSASKWDIFVGYSFFYPNATVNGYSETSHHTAGPISPVSFNPEKIGTVESLTRFFTPHLGLEINSGQHDLYNNTNNAKGQETGSSNSGLFTMQTGPFYRWRDGRWTPWVHGLVGGVSMQGPNSQSYTPGETFTLGGGIDYELSHHWALRSEADYEYVHVNYGSPYLGSDGMDWDAGGVVNANGFLLAAGIVYHIYPGSHPPPALDCSASPAWVFPGEPVTVTATSSNLNHRLNAAYFWSGPGVTGNGTTATVDTAKLAPGTYTVNGQLREGKTGKEGLKPGETADCSTSFTVRHFEPPTVSCHAAPGAIQPGAPSTITAAGVSPQNRPLTYSYSAASGTIHGSGTTAEFDSAGAPSGPVRIVCTVTDDGGQTATSETSVTIAPPYVPPVSRTEALCSLSFGKDKMRPTRVDNEAKACLDEIALGLQKQPDAAVVLVGSEDARERARIAREEELARRNRHVKVQDFAAERAVNAKEYLVREKGIDAARISVATSASGGQSAQDYMVPAGADFSSDVAGTTPVNETAVKPQVRKPLGMRTPHRKHSHKTHMRKKHIAHVESAPETRYIKPPQ